ncbi:universal stress protein [Actinosynnema sp. CA-248983]
MSSPEVTGRGAVVVGYDGSEPAGEAVAWACAEAGRRGRPLLVVDVVHGPFPELVFTPMTMPLPEVVGERSVVDFHASSLAEVAERCGRDEPGIEVGTYLARGRPAEVLQVLSEEADLVVVGWSGRTGVSRFLLGSTAAHLVHHARRPVVVVRGPSSDAGSVVVGVDGSAAGARAIDFAFEHAALRGGRVVAVHAWADMPIEAIAPMEDWNYNWHAVRRDADAVVAECLAGARERYPDVPVERVVRFDSPAHALIDQSRDAALLVVGSHGRGALRRALLGSVSHAVLYHGDCTLAVVPDPRRSSS